MDATQPKLDLITKYIAELRSAKMWAEDANIKYASNDFKKI